MPDERIPKYVGPDTIARKRKLTSKEIKERFDRETAALYSGRDVAWLPEFQYIFNLVPELIAPHVRRGDSILDIGAGTGNLSRSILEKIDFIDATLIDFSENMLAEAPKVLANCAGRYKTIVSDFIVDEFPSQKYSAIVSSFAIHHCRGKKQYLEVYKKIFHSLKKASIFVCCDVVSGSNEGLALQNENGWNGFMKEQGFSDDERNRVLSNYHVEDTPESIGTHMKLLTEAGFGIVDVVWKKYNFAVYIGISE